jgi:plasmid stability protein
MHFAFMKTMTIRNVPDEVYDALVELAKKEHRSLQEQVRYTLENDVALRKGSVCEQALTYRTRLENRSFSSTVVEDIREDRDR